MLYKAPNRVTSNPVFFLPTGPSTPPPPPPKRTADPALGQTLGCGVQTPMHGSCHATASCSFRTKNVKFRAAMHHAFLFPNSWMMCFVLLFRMFPYPVQPQPDPVSMATVMSQMSTLLQHVQQQQTAIAELAARQEEQAQEVRESVASCNDHVASISQQVKNLNISMLIVFLSTFTICQSRF